MNINNALLTAIVTFVMTSVHHLHGMGLLSEWVYSLYYAFIGPFLLVPLVAILFLEEPRWQDRAKIAASGLAGHILCQLLFCL